MFSYVCLYMAGFTALTSKYCFVKIYTTLKTFYYYLSLINFSQTKKIKKDFKKWSNITMKITFIISSC